MIGIVGHDPGAIEIISSYVFRNELSCLFCVEGPALNVVSRRLGTVELLSLEQLIEKCDWFICGTSSSSNLEWRAIALAREAGKRCVVVLDHWVNYRNRFMRYGTWHWPDEVWVGDDFASRIAYQELPEVKQVLVPNAYFMDIQDEINSIELLPRHNNLGSNILFVSEPVREGCIALYKNERYLGYTEEDALIYFLSNVAMLSDHINRITIRPHPKESLFKYDWILDKFDLPLISGERRPLLDQIKDSDIVVGCTTMAMVVGLLAGKRVVSCIPPGGKTQRLPQTEIEYMTEMLPFST